MDNARERLMALLTEMFQLDQADLDFGIYRVMNHKREEVAGFLRGELIPAIETAFKTNVFAEFEQIETQIKNARSSAFELGLDPNDSPKVKALEQRRKDLTDPKSLEAEVCSDLVTFFSRYYQSGDFVSRRRYKDDVYAIPYQGEEVKLHWANHDQYYIKSSERLSRYAFNLPTTNRRVRFEVVTGATEKDNVKAAQDRERRFTLATPPWEIEGDELVFRFAYRASGTAAREDEGADSEHEAGESKTPSQQECNALTAKTVKKRASTLGDWASELLSVAPTGKNVERTLFEKHLDRFTKRNDFDYFIHKDLRGFLRRELDVFVKTEVFHLDDVERQGMQRVEQAMAKIRVLREVAHKLIEFLAQLEDFQKTLWLKKKFVFGTSWCVTIDRVPETLWDDVLKNDRQREDWVRLFAIDKIEKDLARSSGKGKLTREFLRENPSLVVDTALFDADFTARLLASIDDLDANTTGVLFNGENFQALQLMQERYRGKVKCIYIDPPYNTGGDGFAYKDGYQHSSWISFMENRLSSAISLLDASTGTVSISVDDNELDHLLLLRRTLGLTSIATVVVQSNPRGRMLGSHLAQTHEYLSILATSDSADATASIAKDDRMMSEYDQEDSFGKYREIELRIRNPAFNPENRPNQWFPLFANPATRSISTSASSEFSEEIWPKNSEDEPSVWSWTPDKVNAECHLLYARQVRTGNWRVFRKDYVPESGATTKAKSIWMEKGINYENARDELNRLFNSVPFNFAKPLRLVENVVAITSSPESIVLDYHAGSGTTGHAVLNLHRGGAAATRFVLVEIGSHFDTVLKPRILKVLYSNEWEDGVPVSRNGRSAIVKVVRLESYEDALENLSPKRTEQQDALLGAATAEFRTQYMLKYMLPWETRGQGSFVDGRAIEHPFDRTLRVMVGDEAQAVTLDFVETFNWLLGLEVSKLDLTGAVKTVRGRLPNGENALVVWRDTAAVSVDQLDAWWQSTPWNADTTLNVVYVNGPHGIEAHRPTGAHWRVERTESVFIHRMFSSNER
jgi:adenine-specific DNA-methyltransferase